jgi:polyisoprenoid-binding protein YceI
MPRKLLQWFGVLFVLGVFGTGLGLLMLVKDRVRVVIDLDEVASGPDPVALLRDDVATLQRELAALQTSLGGNFERLGTALEERAEARHADVGAMAREVLAVKTGQEAQRGSLVRVGSQLEAVERRLADLAAQTSALAAVGAAPAGPAAAPTAAPTEAPPPVAVEPVPVAVAPQPPSADPTPTPEAPPAKKASFLSFSVPDAKFAFDEKQDYVLVGDLCRVGFDAKSTLHDFTGVTSKVAGRFTADFDDPQGAWQGEVTCEAATLVTGVEGRDENLREHLDTAHTPQIRFVVDKFEPTAVDAAKMTAKGTVRGRMTIRGKTRDVAMPVDVSVDPSKRVVVEGQMPLLLSDYEVPVPSQLGGTITMQDEVKVWVALRARVQTGGRK